MTDKMWITHHILATTTFFGVLLTRSSSTFLDLTMCLCTILLIGLAANFIAELDLPYAYRIDRAALTYVLDLLTQTHTQLGGDGGGGRKKFKSMASLGMQLTRKISRRFSTKPTVVPVNNAAAKFLRGGNQSLLARKYENRVAAEAREREQGRFQESQEDEFTDVVSFSEKNRYLDIVQPTIFSTCGYIERSVLLFLPPPRLFELIYTPRVRTV